MNLFLYQVATGNSSTIQEVLDECEIQEETLELKMELLGLEERLLKLKPHVAGTNTNYLKEKEASIDKMTKWLLEKRIDTLKPYVEFHEKNGTVFIKKN